MKIPSHYFRIVSVALLLAGSVRLVAQTVDFYGVDKRLNYLQNSSGTPAFSGVPGDGDHAAAHFDISISGSNLNLLSAAKITLPNSTQYTMTNSNNMDYTELGWGNPSPAVHGFDTKSAMDAAFPNGTYTMTVGSVNVPLALGATDSYPSAIPQITGGTWNGQGQLVVNATTGATVNINTFSNYTGAGVVQATIFSYSNNQVGDQLVAQMNVNVTGFASDPQPTSFSIAANALRPGQVYYGELSYIHLVAADTTSVSGALGHGDYQFLTGFMLATAGAYADLNGDGKTDLVWSNTSTGERYIWLMNGTSFSSSVFLGVMPVQWEISATGDFNGDGKTDLVWSNTSTGERYLWLMNGTTYSSSVFLGTMPTQWKISTAGDFNGDGKTDLVWSNSSTGERYLWLMNGTTYTSSVFLGTIGTQWQIAGAGDFDGDGKTDLVWSNTSTGERYLWLMNGTAFNSSVFLGTIGTQWQIAGAGDFNGDGKADLIWSNTSTGERYLWLMNGTSFSSSVALGVTGTQWVIKD